MIGKDLRASGLPAHVCDFVECLLVARGADQAFRTKTELINYKKVETMRVLPSLVTYFLQVIQHMQKHMEKLEAELSVLAAIAYAAEEDPDVHPRPRSFQKIAQKLDECRGSLHVLRDVRTWTAAICKISRFPSDERMFVAGDAFISRLPAAMSEQGGLNFRLRSLSRFVQNNKEESLQVIQQLGWPPSATFTQEGKHQCRVCKKGFGRKWIKRSICWKCENDSRDQGRCPYEDGNLCYVCPHLRACLLCERLPCMHCRMVHSEDMAEDVSSFVQELNPDVLIVDFDQTLCETRSGCAPVVDKHAMNSDICNAIKCRPTKRNVILTRQNFKNEPTITRYLDQMGMKNVEICCVGGKRNAEGEKMSKSDMMFDLVPCGSVLFIDDDLRELMEREIAQCDRITRLLFFTTTWDVKYHQNLQT